jgi:RNA polymerase sigma-70 factor, ECF subfamily
VCKNPVTVTARVAGYLIASPLMAPRLRVNDDQLESLLTAAAQGDSTALQTLLEQHRHRLRRMVDLRLDSRVSSRLDGSDVVQEALLDAARKLTAYVRERPLPFYAWLHRLAAERVATAHRRHLRSERRSVAREEAENVGWSDGSVQMLVDRLVAGDPTPGHALASEERRGQVHAALARLATADREVLVMRYLEDLTFPEIAAILGIAEGATKMRHLRAIERIRSFMEGDSSGSAPN